MKLFVVVILALVAQNYANYLDSSEEDSRQSRNRNAQREINELLMSSGMESSTHWQSAAASLPEASSFKSKVTHRIKNSSDLSGMSQLKENLYKLANEKLEKCMKPNGRELDRHCVGRATGQVMQLIASAENASRHTVHGGHRRQQDNY
ncbi:uncharacterized protein LOC135958728 [Calliphora vicina]|uniref:uncharacterized protein LOC135958728 n=1 Tax=Calliphora vicina TaxID=7373 RepID=UPI00325B8960